MGSSLRLSSLCLLAFLAAGCSGGAPKAQIVSSSEQRLIARAEPLADGKVRLRVGREWSRELERAASCRDGVQVATGPASYVSDGTTGDPGGLMAALFPVAIAVVLAPFVFLVQQFLSLTGIHPPEGATVLTSETVYDPTWKATIEPASGEFVLDLGAQPKEGYVLDADTVRRLGPDVVVRDHDLFTALRLPADR
jgi:hypothetical protein